MGFFSAIQKAALTPVAGVGNLIGQGLAQTGVVKFKPQTTTELQSTTFGKVLGTAIAATAATTAVVAFPSAAASLVTKTNPVTGVKTIAPIKAAVTGLSTIAGISYLETKPEGIYKIPAGGIKAASDAGTLAANPTLPNALDYIKENPEASILLGGVAAYFAGKTIAPAVGLIVASGKLKDQAQAIREQTEVIKNQGAGIPQATGGGSSVGSDSTLQTDTQGITTPQTQSISTKKRSRKAKVKRFDGVRQSVRVNVINRNSVGRKTITYLNRVPMYN